MISIFKVFKKFIRFWLVELGKLLLVVLDKGLQNDFQGRSMQGGIYWVVLCLNSYFLIKIW